MLEFRIDDLELQWRLQRAARALARDELDIFRVFIVLRVIPLELPAFDDAPPVREHDLDQIGFDRYLLLTSVALRWGAGRL